MMTKTATINLEFAKEHYGKDKALDEFLIANFPELEGKQELTKKWEEIGNIEGWLMDDFSDNSLQENFATESQAKSALAFAQLSQIAKEANDRANWKPDWFDGIQEKWVIERYDNTLIVDDYSVKYHHIVFHSKEASEESLIKHESLWKDYWEIV